MTKKIPEEKHKKLEMEDNIRAIICKCGKRGFHFTIPYGIPSPVFLLSRLGKKVKGNSSVAVLGWIVLFYDLTSVSPPIRRCRNDKKFDKNVKLKSIGSRVNCGHNKLPNYVDVLFITFPSDFLESQSWRE